MHLLHRDRTPRRTSTRSSRLTLWSRLPLLWLALLLTAASLVPAPAGGALRAQATAPGAGQLPSPVGYVNDFANVLPPDTRARLEDLARRVNAATRGDMVIVTLPDLGGRPLEEVSLRLGREWRIGADAAIGDQARNAGVVILLVPKETSSDGRGYCRIETGQGAEAFITDATSGAICRAETPRFVAQDYAGALESIAGTVAERYAAEFGVRLDGQPQQRARRQPSGGGTPIPFWAIVLVFVVLPIILSRGGRGRRSGCVGCLPIPIGGPTFGGGYSGGMGGGWGGGGFGGSIGGGGFGGFGGGGGFSGGGGGSSW